MDYRFRSTIQRDGEKVDSSILDDESPKQVPIQQLAMIQGKQIEAANMTSRDNQPLTKRNSQSNLDMGFRIKKQGTQHDIYSKEMTEEGQSKKNSKVRHHRDQSMSGKSNLHMSHQHKRDMSK